jgi:sodium-dependent dicarboxylate transporter 2/3/5
VWLSFFDVDDLNRFAGHANAYALFPLVFQPHGQTVFLKFAEQKVGLHFFIVVVRIVVVEPEHPFASVEFIIHHKGFYISLRGIVDGLLFFFFPEKTTAGDQSNEKQEQKMSMFVHGSDFCQKYMNRSKLHLLLGPLLAVLILAFADLDPARPELTRMVAVLVWIAWWWLTEPVHLAVTSLLPIVLLPLLGIAGVKQVAQSYMDDIIFLFIGGFLLAFAVERWHLHRRIAVRILLAVGTKPSGILLGVMLTSFFISMWISNTATVMMLFSAVLALLHQVESFMPDEKQHQRFSAALLIGLAYSATVGGMATLVGTPTNMIFYSRYLKEFPEATDMNFVEWMKWGLPIALLLLFAVYFILRLLFICRGIRLEIERSYFQDVRRELGPLSYEEKVISGVFTATVLLWFLRSDIDFGGFKLHGWASWFGSKSVWMQDAIPAVLASLVLFLWPSRSERGRNLLEWKEAERIPLDVILLFGAGFAISLGFQESGLNEWLAPRLSFLQGLPLPVVVFGLCVIITIISEFATNVACIQLILPILLAMAAPLGVHPLELLVPATLASSLGFVLPVATAPNTIVFSSRRIQAKDMYKAGIPADLAGILLITLASTIYSALK